MLVSIVGAAPFAYVINADYPSGINVIDTATDKVVSYVDGDLSGPGVTVNPAGTKVYVTNYGDNTVSVIDTTTNKVTATVKVGSGPSGVAVSLNGKKVYVSNYRSSGISVIDTATNKVTGAVDSGEYMLIPTAFGQFIGPSVPPTKPAAAFSESPRSGTKPLKVQFTDKSTGSPTSWKWDFGDGTTSTTHNPLHTYIKKGKLTVKLTVKNAAGSNTKIISNYITVK